MYNGHLGTWTNSLETGQTSVSIWYGDSLKLGKVTQRTKQKLGERGRKDVGRMLK